MIEVIYLLIGALISAIASFIIAKKLFAHSNTTHVELEIQLKMLNEQFTQSKLDLSQSKSDKEELLAQVGEIQPLRDQLNQAQEGLKENKQEFKELTQTLSDELESEKLRVSHLRAEMAVLEEQIESTHQRMEDDKDRVDELKNQFKSEFENLSQKIFDEKSQQLNVKNQEQLSQILNPLGERLKSFEDRVEKQNVDGAKRFGQFDEQLKQLLRMNDQLSEEARSLSQALKGENKTIGDYGEVILRQVLDYSGLQPGIGYTEQGEGLAIQGENGNHLKPDVLLHLPDEGYLVVDSKMSLQSYDALVNADAIDVEPLEKHFVKSVEAHIKNLASKDYPKALGRNKTPDYVLLFMPIEHSFHLATRHGTGLYDKAWKDKIILVSPSTLLATLRTLENIWKREAINTNAQKIAEEAGKVYDKFVGFLEDMTDLGKSLHKANEQFDKAQNKLSAGRGNVIRTLDKVKSLGARGKKDIPRSLLDQSDELNDEELKSLS